MVAGVTDLNLTVPGRGLNLAAGALALCLAASCAAVKLGFSATPMGFAVMAGLTAPAVTFLIADESECAGKSNECF